MKVIDLLNKIANGEEPKNIKYKYLEYELLPERNNYYCSKEMRWFTNEINALGALNKEVEIIEEDKKIKHIENYIGFTNLKDSEKFDYLYEMETRIIDYINKENRIKRVAMNKDFYDGLPGIVCNMLDELIKKYGKEEWFKNAWEEYRKHILLSSIDDMKMPGYVFNKYINKEK